MSLVTRFDPPAYLPDFNDIPGQREAWHRAVSAWFDASIAMDQHFVGADPLPFYNPASLDPGGTRVEQAITWNAFPKELLRRFGRERALEEADTLWTLDRYWTDLKGAPVSKNDYPQLFKNYFRPQDEYCEWRVTRDPATNAIRCVTLVSEPPEYWYALAGFNVPNDPNAFPGDRERMVELYRALTGQSVQWADLIAPETIDAPGGALAIKGQYNPYNKWNTTHGIVHLQAPPNALTAEIQLGADATVLRQNAKGKLLVEADALICCASYGGPDRNSDPTIGSSVNALARLGAYVTLANPVGLYMDHIDLSGWEAGDGKGVTDCVRIVRGTLEMIERIVVEVPPERGLTVSDLTIGGIPIQYGGQIAECVTVKLVGVANVLLQPLPRHPVECDARCCVDGAYPRGLRRPISLAQPLPIGTEPVFLGQGGEEGSSSTAASSAAAKPMRTSATPIRRLRGRID